MCGRYTLKATTSAIAERFDVAATQATIEVEPRYNIAPSQVNPVIVRNGSNKIELMQWGLVPFWSKEPKVTYSTINARGEEVADKPLYRQPLRRHRCLVPATGFFEWQAQEGVTKRTPKIPYHIQVTGDDKEPDIFAFAGLYDIWRGKDGEELKTYTIITTEANELMQPIHNRMPVILPREAENIWLDPDLHDPAELLPLLKPYPANLMIAYPVSTAVNKPATDNPELIAPLNSR